MIGMTGGNLSTHSQHSSTSISTAFEVRGALVVAPTTQAWNNHIGLLVWDELAARRHWHVFFSISPLFLLVAFPSCRPVPKLWIFREVPRLGKEGRFHRPITSDQNLNREFLIQLIQGVYLIHYDKFYLKIVPKNLLCVNIQGSAKRLRPGFVNAAGKLRQRSGRQQQDQDSPNLAEAF